MTALTRIQLSFTKSRTGIEDSVQWQDCGLESSRIPGWGTQVPTQPPVQQASSHEAKQPALVADGSLSSSGKIMNVWSCTFTPYVYIVMLN